MFNRRAFIVLLAVLSAPGGAAATPPADEDESVVTSHGVASGSGVIQALDFANNRLVIDGLEYGVAVDVKVEIGGSYGALTLLRKGMKVYFEYLAISPSSRRLVTVRELPDDVVLEQV